MARMNMRRTPAILRLLMTAIGVCLITGILFSFEKRSAKAVTDEYFLAISDVHLHDGFSQRDICSRCSDAGNDLWKVTRDKIQTILSGKSDFPKPTFILYLGDLPWHVDGNKMGSQKEYEDSVKSAMQSAGVVLTELRELAEEANIPLLYVPGNNDSPEGDYGAFTTTIFNNDKEGSKSWPVIGGISDHPEGNKAASVPGSNPLLSSIGCYSAYPLGKSGKLRVIVLNTTVFVPGYQDQRHQQSQAAAQINWLDSQLQEAVSDSERVIIGMHVPPGINGYNVLHRPQDPPNFWSSTLQYDKDISVQNAFLDLLEKYRPIITGILCSHTHLDGIRLMNNRNGELINIIISVPGIAPGHGNNPSMKLISYNPADYELTNFITLYHDYNTLGEMTPWMNNSFDFRSLLQNNSDAPLRKWIGTVPEATLTKVIQVIYKTGNGAGDPAEIDTALHIVR